jgi:hypothetical protein
MAFFDEISKKTKDMAENVKLNSALSDKEKLAVKQYEQLGRMYYASIIDNVPDEYASIVNSIKATEASIADTKHQINALKGIVYCPNCKAECPANSAFCLNCGTSIASVTNQNQRVCKNCGATLDKSVKFCTSCGTKVDDDIVPPQPSVVATNPVCTNCGFVLEEGSAFCTNCGKPVASDSAKNIEDFIQAPVEEPVAPVAPVQEAPIVDENNFATEQAVDETVAQEVVNEPEEAFEETVLYDEAEEYVAPVEPVEEAVEAVNDDVEASSINPVDAVESNEVQQTAPAKVCPNCSAPLREDALFCVECGAKVDCQVQEAPASKTCFYCGSTVDADAMFCTNCGQKL